MWITSQAQESSGIKTIDLWYQTTVCQTLPCQRVRPRDATCTNNGSGVMMISRRCSWRLWIFYLELWKIFFGCDGDTRDEGHSWALMDMNSNKSINQLMYALHLQYNGFIKNELRRFHRSLMSCFSLQFVLFTVTATQDEGGQTRPPLLGKGGHRRPCRSGRRLMRNPGAAGWRGRKSTRCYTECIFKSSAHKSFFFLNDELKMGANPPKKNQNLSRLLFLQVRVEVSWCFSATGSRWLVRFWLIFWRGA